MKKIIILTSKGGGGHLAVSEALSSYLSPDFSVHSILTFADLMQPIDMLSRCSAGRFNWIALYNSLIRKKHFRTLNVLQTIGSWYINRRKTTLKRIFIDFLKKEQPDLVISVVPLVNGVLIKSTEALDIPLIIIPTDLNASMVIHGIHNSLPSSAYFAYSFDDPAIKKTFAPAKINSSQCIEIGFPLRPSFFTPEDTLTIKKNYNIPLNKPIALLLMGYQGSRGIETFVRELSKVPVSFHIIICTGKDTHMAQKIKNLSLPNHISMTIIGFTEYIADLMGIADLFIGKSGSVSVLEALYMNVPLFLDATTNVLRWEQFNHDWIEQHGFGHSIKHKNNIVPLVTRFLTDAPYRQAMKNNIRNYSKKNARAEVMKLIKSLI